MKSVAIIGAGPAGIIAARKLLQSGKFTVTIYEQNDHVGGSWLPEGIIDPKMRTNQSKFTMNFSDLSWESLGPSEDFGDLPESLAGIALSGELLRALHSSRGCTVPCWFQEVRQVKGDAEKGQLRWELKLHAHSKNGTIESFIATFDYVVAAPRFFYNSPKSPPFPRPTGSHVPILHSTQYRGLDAIGRGFTSEISGKRRVLVIGSSHSGGEIAALIASQLSNAQYSPGTSESERVKWTLKSYISVRARCSRSLTLQETVVQVNAPFNRSISPCSAGRADLRIRHRVLLRAWSRRKESRP
ncbi:FAD/NAD(P)-binding domain-containing protein [Bimuria novae-zelandiae CBS 107.79]|uniref:FAD/NAD(P)-binding domain-containing protein n=1 Tax=Bimuria novae-zelandiae CBS 107.79 TaxID=1447943 RepID=A0A6A5V197_9PLEO|nr:FAD/NAD(P)-binding domain-containing protein [Bimuria novae-zelandiae CBS 107.79]